MPFQCLPVTDCPHAVAAFATGLLAANESTPFNWESKVHDVIPEWQLQDPFATNMTDFVDLLSKWAAQNSDFPLGS